MGPVPVLPDDVWGRIILRSPPAVHNAMKKVSKSMRALVKIAVQKRWDLWRSKANRPVHQSLPAERGDALDNVLFKQICSGKRGFVITTTNQYERLWLNMRWEELVDAICFPVSY